MCAACCSEIAASQGISSKVATRLDRSVTSDFLSVQLLSLPTFLHDLCRWDQRNGRSTGVFNAGETTKVTCPDKFHGGWAPRVRVLKTEFSGPSMPSSTRSSRNTCFFYLRRGCRNGSPGLYHTEMERDTSLTRRERPRKSTGELHQDRLWLEHGMRGPLCAGRRSSGKRWPQRFDPMMAAEAMLTAVQSGYQGRSCGWYRK